MHFSNLRSEGECHELHSASSWKHATVQSFIFENRLLVLCNMSIFFKTMSRWLSRFLTFHALPSDSNVEVVYGLIENNCFLRQDKLQKAAGRNIP